MKAYETVGEFTPDFLVYDTKFPVDTKTIPIASGVGVLARGSVIAVPATNPSAGYALWSGAEGETADCVLCDDIDTGDTTGSIVIAHAYRSGHLCRQALILGGSLGALTDAAEAQLRDAGIYLSNAVI